MIIPKAFLEAVRTFSKDPKKVKNYYNDKRITTAEKKVLDAYYLYRNNKLNEAFGLLQNINSGMNPLSQAIKDFICAVVDSARGNFSVSIPKFLTCLETFKINQLDELEYKSHVALFITYLNLNEIDSMARSLKMMKAMNGLSDCQKKNISLCELDYSIQRGLYDKADLLIQQVEKSDGIMLEHDKVNYLLMKFDYYIKVDDLRAAREILKEAKNFRKYNLTANYNFMKTLLDYLELDRPIYINSTDFKDNQYLLAQISLIKYLEERNDQEARGQWSKLQVFDPVNFKNFSDCHLIKNLFTLCLHKHSHTERINIDTPKNSELSKYELLKETLLKTRETPVNKEELFELVWGRPVETKEDIIKLAKYIYKLKKRDHLKIKSKKGCYFLDNDKKIAS